MFFFTSPEPPLRAALVRDVEAQIRAHDPTADDADVGDLGSFLKNRGTGYPYSYIIPFLGGICSLKFTQFI